MPPWIFTLLFLFLAAGVGLLFWGALTSITTGVLVGTIYALVGVMAISLSYGLKVQFERDAEDQLRAIRESRRIIRCVCTKPANRCVISPRPMT